MVVAQLVEQEHSLPRVPRVVGSSPTHRGVGNELKEVLLCRLILLG